MNNAGNSMTKYRELIEEGDANRLAEVLQKQEALHLCGVDLSVDGYHQGGGM